MTARSRVQLDARMTGMNRAEAVRRVGSGCGARGLDRMTAARRARLGAAADPAKPDGCEQHSKSERAIPGRMRLQPGHCGRAAY